MKHGWQALDEAQKEDNATVRARWELNDASTTDEVGSPHKCVATMV